jgi:hypothetical protein
MHPRRARDRWDDEQVRTVRLPLSGKGAVLAHRFERPLPLVEQCDEVVGRDAALVVCSTLLGVTAGPDVAFAWALLNCATHEQQLATPELRLRLTIGLEKRDGRWVITHEHHSFADPT